ncbi:LysM peptidoglycan-binding domain-containing protein [Gordonia sp. OPL2]|nr:LysM peptidoglycan-binding domain-containing protein [Gordonia sp. OPL2]
MMSTATLTRTTRSVHAGDVDVAESDQTPTPARRRVAGASSGTPVREPRQAAAGTRPRRMARVEPTRPVDRRPAGPVPTSRAAGTRCAAPAVDQRVYVRRRTAAAAVVVGAALALMVWVIAIVGSNYAASVAPTPVGTEVVHVRAGDTLSSIADRVAPDLPRQSVIDQIVERNNLSGAGLRVGQALVAPAYR